MKYEYIKSDIYTTNTYKNVYYFLNDYGTAEHYGLQYSTERRPNGFIKLVIRDMKKFTKLLVLNDCTQEEIDRITNIVNSILNKTYTLTKEDDIWLFMRFGNMQDKNGIIYYSIKCTYNNYYPDDTRFDITLLLVPFIASGNLKLLGI